MQSSVVVVAILLIVSVLIMYHIWTNKDVKKCSDENENLDRMYIEDMMGKKEDFWFNRDGKKKYYFRRAQPKWDPDGENFSTMQLAKGGILDCVDDEGGDRCADTQFFSVFNKVDIDITEEECKQLHGMFHHWWGVTDPRVTFPENAPKGGTCIAKKKRSGNNSTSIEFLWSNNS